MRKCKIYEKECVIITKSKMLYGSTYTSGGTIYESMAWHIKVSSVQKNKQRNNGYMWVVTGRSLNMRKINK